MRSVVRITKEFRYEGAHTLIGYDGKCRHIHGHSYLMYVTVIGRPSTDTEHPKNGMILDFKLLKQLVQDTLINRFDHALVMPENAVLAEELQTAYGNVIQVPFQPTSENMVIYFAEELTKALPTDIQLHSIRLYETVSSYVEWFASDNLPTPCV